MELINFYIGSLEINVYTEIPLDLRENDRKFFIPCVPPERSVDIGIGLTDSLPEPGGERYRTGNRTVVPSEDGEWRIYDFHTYSAEKDGKAGAVSRYSPDERKQVQLFILREWWECRKDAFCLWYYIHLEELLLNNNAVILHSASILFQKQSVLFTAPSGTGKTTQTDLWHKYMDGISDINGDRTVLQKTHDGWTACGFPLCGTSGRCEQRSAPARILVVIRQGKEDAIRELSDMEKVSLLYREITIPNFGKHYPGAAISLIENLVRSVPVIRMDCTMNRSAADVLYQYLLQEDPDASGPGTSNRTPGK